MENKFTFKEYKFPNGETIKCTVAFVLLLKLRENNKKLYEVVNDGLLNGVKDLVTSAEVLYGAYLCACYAGENGGIEAVIPKDEFIGKLDDDLVDVYTLCISLIHKKKN